MIVLERDSKPYRPVKSLAVPVPPPVNEKGFLFWVKKINKVNLADYFLPGYELNKVVFKVGIAIIFFWLLAAAWSINFDLGSQVYVSCPPGVTPCVNPFYDPLGLNPTCLKYDVCDRELLLPGMSFGSPPSFLMKYAEIFTWFVVALMIMVNHFLFNRGIFKGVLKELREGKL